MEPKIELTQDERAVLEGIAEIDLFEWVSSLFAHPEGMGEHKYDETTFFMENKGLIERHTDYSAGGFPVEVRLTDKGRALL